MKKLIILAATAITLVSCNFLEPISRGMISQDEIEGYPTYVRGYLEKCYYYLPTSYNSNEFANLDALCDNAVMTDVNHAMNRFANGTLQATNDPFGTYWNRFYQIINSANLFLQDNIGINTTYEYTDNDLPRRRRMQGEAFAHRAWAGFCLLRMFGGQDASGEYLGFPIRTEPADFANIDIDDVRRDSYSDCVAQIISDCDSALKYLPKMYRDAISDNIAVTGGASFHRLDQLSVLTIKALTYLQWASPAFNPQGDASRWEKAAEAAAKAIDIKMEVDGGNYGFQANQKFDWGDPNSAEIIWSSFDTKGHQYESAYYPDGQGGNSIIGPSQELVDAFPMANGYPIRDSRSGYDPSKPYDGRDPRFYENIYYHNAKIGTLYTIDASVTGTEAPRAVGSTRTGYFLRKFTYNGYNKDATNPVTKAVSVAFLRWTHLLLAYAESMNQAYGPTANPRQYAMTAKDAIAAIRSREQFYSGPTPLAASDPYLDECAGSKAAFDALVRNERRIETCFEGLRMFDLQRWSKSASDLNVTIHAAKIEGGSYDTEVCETRTYQSQWFPIPYNDCKNAGNLIQNAGWEAWK